MPGEHPVEAAYREGKIPKDRRAHYMELMAKNPKKTKRLLASLEPCLTPPDDDEAWEAMREYAEEQPPQAAPVAAKPPVPPEPIGGNVIKEPGIGGVAAGGGIAGAAQPGEVL